MNKKQQRESNKAAAAQRAIAPVTGPVAVLPEVSDSKIAEAVAKALEGVTPAEAVRRIAERKARLSAAAAKAHATRKANGTAGVSAKAAWTTRRAVNAALEQLARKAS